ASARAGRLADLDAIGAQPRLEYEEATITAEAESARRRDRRGRTTVTQNQIITAFVRGAAWQLMRRSPTWLLLAIVAGAFCSRAITDGLRPHPRRRPDRPLRHQKDLRPRTRGRRPHDD